MVCPKCGQGVTADDLTCPHCDAALETVIIKRATRGRRYVYGKRKAGLSPEVIWLLIVILVGILIIVGTQLYAFMRSRKLVEAPGRPVAVARALPSFTATPARGDRALGAPASCRQPFASCAAIAAATRGASHELRLRHLCHADRPPRGGDPGPGRPRV